LRVLVRSVSEWMHEAAVDRRVLVGWDTRFASAEMAETSAAILAEFGLIPLLSQVVTPTPAVTFALAHDDYAGALVLTASHNPALDHGLKVFGPHGGTIDEATARRIEAIAQRRRHETGPALATPVPRRVDFLAPYRAALDALLDHEAFARIPVSICYDAMHGSGGGILDAVLEDAGARIRRLRCQPDPDFGGHSPDPIPERLTELSRETRRAAGLTLGLATDGDGDRVGVVDGRGRVLSETQVVALLIDHLARAGRIERGVAITAGTGSLVLKVAASHGLPVERHPVGFKYLSAAMASGRADVAGEESGGFALASMGRDKDGLLAGCLLANLVATSGEALETHVDRLERRFGASACGRRAISRTPELDLALDHLVRNPPDSVGGVAVESVEGGDSLRLELSDGGFLMLRRSGTEPMIRLYSEAAHDAALIQRLDAGQGLLGVPQTG
jgi:phosphomannomutase